MEELISLMMIPMLRDWSSHDEVDDVGKPGRMAQAGKEMLIEEWVTNVSYTKWSATEFLLPFLSFISKSNSWRSSTHRMSRGLASFLERKYFRAAWLV